MEQILPYLINTVLGAGGGYLGNMLKKLTKTFGGFKNYIYI